MVKPGSSVSLVYFGKESTELKTAMGRCEAMDLGNMVCCALHD